MRRWLGLILLGLTSCTPQTAEQYAARPPAPVADAEVFLDQGWSMADRNAFYTTPQGSYLMPLPWFLALRRTDADAPFVGDELQRYGYLPSPGQQDGSLLPVGFVRDGPASDQHVGMTCAACHTGQLRYGGTVWRIDGGRSHADFQAFLTDLGSAAQATLAEPDRFATFAAAVLGAAPTTAATAQLRQRFADWTTRYNSFMAASLPTPAWGPGRLDAFGMIFNRVTGLDLNYPQNLAKADAPVRYPFLWDAPRQDHTQWTGAAPNGTYLRGLARNTGEVFGVFGRFAPTPIPVRHAIYRNAVNFVGLQALEEKVVALRAPRWPADVLPLDTARVRRGSEVFEANCSSCHAATPERAKPSNLVQNAWATQIIDVGTDRRTFDNSQRLGSPRALLHTQQPPLIGERLAEPSPSLSILANAVVGSLLRAAVLGDPGIRRAIARDIAEGRLPLRNLTPSPVPAASAANIASATQDLYKLPGQRPGAAYEARVLTGIWAVGPYLHNGSVPSLAELLKPATERMTQFAVGHRDFDPVNVGLETGHAPGRTMYRVRSCLRKRQWRP